MEICDNKALWNVLDEEIVEKDDVIKIVKKEENCGKNDPDEINGKSTLNCFFPINTFCISKAPVALNVSEGRNWRKQHNFFLSYLCL